MLSPTAHEPLPPPVAESRASWLAWAIAPPGVAVALGAIVAATGANRALFVRLNSALSVLGDFFWSNVTSFGDAMVATALLALVFRRWPAAIGAIAVAALLTAPTVHVLKDQLYSDRPPIVLAPGEFHLIGAGHRFASFPSGHSATIFAMAGAVALAGCRAAWARAALLAGATLVALSRIAVGVHWPLDVVAGAAIGWAAAAAGARSIRYVRLHESRFFRRAAGIVVVLVTFVATFVHEVAYADAWVLQRLVCASCLGWGVWDLVLVWRQARPDGGPLRGGEGV